MNCEFYLIAHNAIHTLIGDRLELVCINYHWHRYRRLIPELVLAYRGWPGSGIIEYPSLSYNVCVWCVRSLSERKRERIMYREAICATLILILCISGVAQGESLSSKHDQLMKKREKYFQVINEPAAPSFKLRDANGRVFTLTDFRHKVVVINFIFANCNGVCPLQSQLIAEVQSDINKTSAKAHVQFISITTDPGNDTPDILQDYPSIHNLDDSNWMFLTTLEKQSEDTTRKLAEAYNVKFKPMDDGQQMHGVVTHIIDRGGRFAAKFHGLNVKKESLVHYISSLAVRNSAKSNNNNWDFWGVFK